MGIPAVVYLAQHIHRVANILVFALGIVFAVLRVGLVGIVVVVGACHAVHLVIGNDGDGRTQAVGHQFLVYTVIFLADNVALVILRFYAAVVAQLLLDSPSTLQIVEGEGVALWRVGSYLQ